MRTASKPVNTTRVERLTALLKRGAAGDTIAIGRELSAQKAETPHGDWLPWLKQFDMSERSAQRYMAAFEWAKSASLADLSGYWEKLHLTKTALYFMVEHVRIAVEGEMPPVAQQIIERARSGWVGENTVREMLGLAPDEVPVAKEQAVVRAALGERDAAEAAEKSLTPRAEPVDGEPEEPEEESIRPGIGGDPHIPARELSVSEKYDEAIATLKELAAQPSFRFDSVTASVIDQQTAMGLIRERLGEFGTKLEEAA